MATQPKCYMSGIKLAAGFLLVLGIAAGCSLPKIGWGGGQTGSTADKSGSEITPATATPAPTREPLPPALVETDPPTGAELNLRGGITFFFNQPMRRESVEKAFSFKPVMNGTFTWLDDREVKFTPAQPLEAGSTLTAGISTDAAAQNGIALQEPLELQFNAAKALRVVEHLPRPGAMDVDPTGAVMVNFSQPVIPLGSDGSGQPPAFSINPAAAGRGEWLNTATYIFYPEPAFEGGKTYTVNLNPALVSTAGAGLSAETSMAASWLFKTSIPGLLSITPDPDQLLYLDPLIKLKFNQPMDRESIRQNLTFKDEAGVNYPGSLDWSDDGTELSFKPDGLLPRNALMLLGLSPTTAGKGGTPMGSELAQAYRTVPQFGVSGMTPAPGVPLDSTNGYNSVTVRFSAPLAKQKLEELVTLEPSIDEFQVSLGGDPYTLMVSGVWRMAAEYRLKIAGTIKDKWDQQAPEPYALLINTAEGEPSLVIPMLSVGGSPALFVTPDHAILPAQVLNLKDVLVSSSRLTVDQFITFSEKYDERQNYDPPLRKMWQEEFTLPRNRSTQMELALTPDKNPLETGLYYINVRNPLLEGKGKYPPPPFMLVSSRVHLTLKRSDDRLFTWAVNLQDNQPAPNLTLSVIDGWENSAAGTCVTDSRGICEVRLPAGNATASYYVISGQPGDENFTIASEQWTSGVAGWSFGVQTDLRRSDPFVYLYTDRPIYRPGQDVNFRAVVRSVDNGRYTLSTLKQVKVSMFGDVPGQSANGGSVSAAVPLDAYGTGWGTFKLPDDAQPGYYSLRIDGEDLDYVDFQVAEYRKPQIDLNVTSKQTDLLAGETLKASVLANYFYGAAAGSKDIHWTLYADATYFDMDGRFQTGKVSEIRDFFGGYPGPGRYVADGYEKTDQAGKFNLEIPLSDSDFIDMQSMQHLTLEVTITDESNTSVSATVTANLHPANFYIGVRPEKHSSPAGEELGIDVQTADWNIAASPGHALKASFQKVHWKSQSLDDWNMFSYPAKPEYEEVSSADLATDSNGQARLAFTPPDAGTYRLVISGEGAVTEVNLWAGGEGTASWPTLPNQRIELQADAKQYAPGQNAKIFIPNPLGTKVLALVTVERARVMRSQVIEIGGANYELDLPIGEEDAPNVYLSVLMLGKNAEGRQDFRLGYLNLEVDPAAQLLQVKMTPSAQRYLPASRAGFDIEVKDSKGAPVQGEFSLALVDKAIFALADPNTQGIKKAFYGQQMLGVINSMGMAIYAGRIPYAPPGRGGGGGDGGGPVVRQNFKDTAYWNTTIVTGADGKARVNVDLPDNLTTWVATLVGVNAEGLVGEAVVNLPVAKDLMVIPATPRFLVAGDHAALAAVVHNNTPGPLKVDVSLEASGVTLDDPKKTKQTIDLAPGAQNRVEWWVKAGDTDQVDLLFSAQAGSLVDRSKPEQGSLPVLKYSLPENFATSGYLSEAGQRLEVVSLPQSFKPTGGKLTVEMTPSLAGIVLEGLKAQGEYEYDATEGILSSLLPDVEAFRALKKLELENPALGNQLEKSVQDNLRKLLKRQNQDGGWGWGFGSQSQDLISSYAVLALSRAARAGFYVDPEIMRKAQEYLLSIVITPKMARQNNELERAVFVYYALQESGITDGGFKLFYDFRQRLNPWAQAMLMMTYKAQGEADPQAETIRSELEAAAERTSSGAFWRETSPDSWNLSTPNFNTAVVVLGLSQFDPGSSLLADAVRYLVAHRGACRCWGSSYESSWVLAALLENLAASGDLKGNFDYSAEINGIPMASGKAASGSTAAPVSASVPLSSLDEATPNGLRIKRGAGDGRLYYRASLEVHRPAADAPAVQNGLTLTRRYQDAGQTCKGGSCKTVDSITAGAGGKMLRVRLSLVVPEDMYYVSVEDTIPAGTEIFNRELKSSSQMGEAAFGTLDYDPRDPLAEGWGWWYFGQPKIYDTKIRWTAEFLPAGPFELSYLLVPIQAGEYQAIPARAFEMYFPEVQASSQGSVLKILP